MEDSLNKKPLSPNQFSEDEKKIMIMRELGIKTQVELFSEKAKEYFSKARATTGQERENYARSILGIQQFVTSKEYREILSSIPTNPEAIYELIRKGVVEDKEVNSLSAKIKKLFSR